jgi:hypothetical protein
MQMHRQELMRSASRRIRRGRRITGRIVASALGFGVAYYFDTENGDLRRKRLYHSAQRAHHVVRQRLAPDVAEPPVVFAPLLRTDAAAPPAARPGERAAAAH